MTPEQIAKIEKIVERVIKEHLRNTQQSDKRILAIIGATQLPLEQVLQQLQLCIEKGWKIRIILSELATKVVKLEPIITTFGEENVLQESDLTNIPATVDEYSQILLPALSYPMAGKLALKLVDTPCTYLVFHALSRSKQVIATSDVKNKREFLNKKSLKLDKIKPEHVNTLSDFGVKWVTTDQIAETIGEVHTPNRVNIKTRVISASVIANLAPNVKELVYTNPTVITPLAREHAQKQGIKLTPEV